MDLLICLKKNYFLVSNRKERRHDNRTYTITLFFLPPIFMTPHNNAGGQSDSANTQRVGGQSGSQNTQNKAGGSDSSSSSGGMSSGSGSGSSSGSMSKAGGQGSDSSR